MKKNIKENKPSRKEILNKMSPEEREAFLANEQKEFALVFEQKEKAHSEKIAAKMADLEKNGKSWNKFWFNFSQLSLFQAIRKWWSKFSSFHPVAAGWVWKIVFFLVFSNGVTIWQYLVMTFLPHAFTSLGTEAWGWPRIDTGLLDPNGEPIFFVIFGDAQGIGYFLAFEIAVFTAQCINFPLQRNITYKSKGNPWYQAMWYFIGWVAISILTNAVWGGVNILMLYWGVATEIAKLLQTFLTGTLSMFVFFFIFLVIFPSGKKGEK